MYDYGSSRQQRLLEAAARAGLVHHLVTPSKCVFAPVARAGREGLGERRGAGAVRFLIPCAQAGLVSEGRGVSDRFCKARWTAAWSC